jgi:crotonobetainyl-CoA:carnitine CoA-transferase CaiB-like acyl-CoA transferase
MTGDALPPLPSLRGAIATRRFDLACEPDRFVAIASTVKIGETEGAVVVAVSSASHDSFIHCNRSAYLELREKGDNDRLKALLGQTDIFVQGYRPGGLADLGFGPEDAARICPGVVYVSLSAYEHVGPWAGRRGFDSLTQTASGMNHSEAEAAGQTAPKALPCQALDHASGYLLAFGALAG